MFLFLGHVLVLVSPLCTLTFSRAYACACACISEPGFSDSLLSLLSQSLTSVLTQLFMPFSALFLILLLVLSSSLSLLSGSYCQLTSLSLLCVFPLSKRCSRFRFMQLLLSRSLLFVFALSPLFFSICFYCRWYPFSISWYRPFPFCPWICPWWLSSLCPKSLFSLSVSLSFTVCLILLSIFRTFPTLFPLIVSTLSSLSVLTQFLLSIFGLSLLSIFTLSLMSFLTLSVVPTLFPLYYLCLFSIYSCCAAVYCLCCCLNGILHSFFVISCLFLACFPSVLIVHSNLSLLIPSSLRSLLASLVIT